jgi:hypothetical protein
VRDALIANNAKVSFGLYNSSSASPYLKVATANAATNTPVLRLQK